MDSYHKFVLLQGRESTAVNFQGLYLLVLLAWCFNTDYFTYKPHFLHLKNTSSFNGHYGEKGKDLA